MGHVKTIIQDYLKKARVLQLATSVNNKPWICNLHFYADAAFNLYWISTPARRHSEEIEQNQNVAVTIKVHEDTPEEAYVIGLSAEGTAELISNDEAKNVSDLYMDKLGKDEQLMKDILSGKNPHRFYRMRIATFVLFDSKNFPDNPRQELKF